MRGQSENEVCESTEDNVERNDIAETNKDNIERNDIAENNKDNIERNNIAENNKDNIERNDIAENNKDNIERNDIVENNKDNIERNDIVENNKDNIERNDIAETNKDNIEINDIVENISIVDAVAACHVLDELYNNGIITGDKSAQLKEKFERLSDTMKVTRANAERYLREGKELMQVLLKQKADLESSESLPPVDTEGTKLRTKCLKHANELAACNGRIYQLDVELAALSEEKMLLEKEVKQVPKQEDIDRSVRDYTQEIEELKIEIAQRANEIKNLTDEHLSRSEHMKCVVKDIKQLEKDKQTLKDELVKTHGEPQYLAKQSELLLRKQIESRDLCKQYTQGITQVNNDIDKLHDKTIALSNERQHLVKLMEDQKRFFEEKEKEVDLLIKECELTKEHQTELLGDRATMELKIKHATMEKKVEHDVNSRKNREKDRDLRNLKRAEIQYKVVREAFAQTQSLHDKVKLQLETQPKDDGTLLEKRKELQREVDIAKRAYLRQDVLTEKEKDRVEQGLYEEAQLIAEQGQLRVDVVDLTRLAQIKADEREQKARDFLKAEVRFNKAKEDLKTKHLSIQDNAKKYVEVQKRLDDFAKLYDIIKNERNKCVNLIQTSTQRAAEMREKIKVLQNETEILRTAAVAKDRLYQKSKLKHRNSLVIRDSLRHEMGKQQIQADELREHSEQQRLTISKLNQNINKAEETLMELRRRYESGVTERNRRGVNLIERNEEVCVLYEKLNVQSSVMRNGDIELQTRDEELRFLRVEAADLKRSVDLLRATVPEKRGLDGELSSLQIQLAQCQDRILVLQIHLEDPSNVNRMRLLSGNDPQPQELTNRIEKLEERLAGKEEQLMEKELIFEQVNNLLDKAKNKFEAGGSDTLLLSKKVNGVQSKIKDTTRKMMALVSELSMNQAMALKLQQEVREKESHLDECYTRMEKNLPPSEQVELEWLKTVRNETRISRDKRQRQKLSEELEHYKISGGIVTTAEPRPNAYIPDDASNLPLPRPYGSNAPFKPIQLGTNMRHIRKPVTKPVEL